MKLHFHKYHGTGNDFILIDNRAGNIRLDKAEVAALCNRRFGIGADGLMLLETAPVLSGAEAPVLSGAKADFRMVYYNADGGESSMCGNGGRCIAAFAKALGIIEAEAAFIAIDGPHRAVIEPDGTVALQMKDVAGIQRFESGAILDTGSPHVVQWVEDVATIDVAAEGRAIRNRPAFAPGGINVNFAACTGAAGLSVRTYERGVEDETLSCGTGVTAVAIAGSGRDTGVFRMSIQTPGGLLEVSFVKNTPDSAHEIVLRGPALKVYEGFIEIAREA